MTMNEVVFKIERQWPLVRYFEELPGAVISQWCNNGERDVYEIRVNDETLLRELERGVTSIPKLLMYHADPQDGVLIVVKECDCYEPGATARLITENNCLLIPPIVYHRGWEHYKIVSFTPEGETRLYKNLEKNARLEILSKTRIVNAGTGGGIRISILSLFSRMTNRQLSAIMTAYENGYYKSPRETTTENLAELMGVTRATYGEHMRKAENKIVSAIAPYLRLLYYRKPSKAPAGHGVVRI